MAPRRMDLHPAEVMEAAVAHGSEHVIKFADSALDTWHRTRRSEALGAIATAIRMDA